MLICCDLLNTLKIGSLVCRLRYIQHFFHAALEHKQSLSSLESEKETTLSLFLPISEEKNDLPMGIGLTLKLFLKDKH